MLIVCHRSTIMPPHRHPVGRSESYHVVEGEMVICLFDNEGSVSRRINLSDKGSNGAFLYRLSESMWHAPIAISEWLVYHETLTGPFYESETVEFPDWLPKDTEISIIENFLKNASTLVK